MQRLQVSFSSTEVLTLVATLVVGGMQETLVVGEMQAEQAALGELRAELG